MALTAVLLVSVSGAMALAQQDQGGFVPAADIARETLPALPLVYGAYGFVWIVLVAYVFMLWRRLGRVEQELRDLSAKIAGGKR
jgi:CcmD family protein